MIKDPRDVPYEEKIRTIRIARQLFANLMEQVVRPEHGETMRRLQRAELETKRLREAMAKPKPKPAPRGNDLGEAIANIGSQPAVAAIRTPEEDAELEAALEEVRRYRGQGR